MAFRAPIALASLLTALALAGVAAAGRAAAGVPAGASVAPASATLFASVDLAAESGQVDALVSLLRRFPAGRALLAQLRRTVESQTKGVIPPRQLLALAGPEADLVVLPGGAADAVVLLRPSPLLLLGLGPVVAQSGLATRAIGDWLAIARGKPALARYAAALRRGALAASPAFRAAVGPLRRPALVTAYLSAAGLASLRSPGALVAVGGLPAGLRQLAPLLGRLRLAEAGRAARARSGLALALGPHTLALDQVSLAPGVQSGPPAGLATVLPAGARAAVDVSAPATGGSAAAPLLAALGRSPVLARAEDELHRRTGVSLEQDVLPLLGGEVAVAAYPSWGPLPTLLVVRRGSGPAAAVHLADRIATALEATGAVTGRGVFVHGMYATELAFRGPDGRPVRVYYGVRGADAVFSTTFRGIDALAGDGPRLAADPRFRQARAAAAAPADETSFAYADVDRLVPWAAVTLRRLGGGPLPPSAVRLLAPLSLAYLWAAPTPGGSRSGAVVALG